MKKFLLFLLIPVLFLASSCTKSVQEVTPSQTILASIAASSWASNDGGKTYSTFVSMPDIDTYQNKYGGVLLYITFDGGITYEQVPQVYGGIAYSFVHSVGQIRIDIQASDGKAVIIPPGIVGIKVVLIPSGL